jgi:predicted unusual protein kinase regulating ubiquinone biosynthesis (AarF/ABC1/UbiB family)
LIESVLNKRLTGETLKSRRQEIEGCLTAFGVVRDTGRRLHRPRVVEREPTQIQGLRQALEHLGPVFSAFGLYMASRVDLLLARDCLELAALADWGKATPIATIRELIARELACPYDEVFPVFEDEPFESRLLFQSHRALLTDSTVVTITVVHPELQGYLEYDLELLPVLKHVFPGTTELGAAIEDAIADFRRMLQWQIDFLYKIKAFEMLARDTREFAMLKIPKVYKDLCSSRMITLEQVSGTPLVEILATVDGPVTERHRHAQAVFEHTGLEPQTLARRLCMMWLRQALLGTQFPVELRPEDLVVLPNKQIAFTGGVFASLPSDAKKNLWHYVSATSTDDPDKACSYLLREIMPEERPIDENELQYRFREVVPFRDGGWSGSGVSSNLTEHLFVHWKLVSARGLRPQPHLLCFYRGLFQTLALVRRLTADSDALLEGLQDLRTITMLAQFQEMMELQTLNENLDKYTTMMMHLPHKFDDALTLAVERSARLKVQGTRPARPHGQHSASPVVIALLLVLASVVLLSHHLTAAAVAGAWVDRISVIVFAIIGVLLLRAASRPW